MFKHFKYLTGVKQILGFFGYIFVYTVSDKHKLKWKNRTLRIGIFETKNTSNLSLINNLFIGNKFSEAFFLKLSLFSRLLIITDRADSVFLPFFKIGVVRVTGNLENCKDDIIKIFESFCSSEIRKHFNR